MNEINDEPRPEPRPEEIRAIAIKLLYNYVDVAEPLALVEEHSLSYFAPVKGQVVTHIRTLQEQLRELLRVEMQQTGQEG